MNRRSFLLSALGVAAAPHVLADATSRDLERYELALPGDKQIARRSLLLVPKHIQKDERLPLVVLCHGLGETDNEPLAMKAWSELYGLISCYERLRRPPIERTLKKVKYLSDEHLATLNAELAAKPFSGLVLACPVTPNTNRLPAGPTLDRYAAWIESTLLPAVRERAPVLPAAQHTALDGVSLGGYVALEVFLRKPELFAAVGTIQGAFSRSGAEKYAKRLAGIVEKSGGKQIRIASSKDDPFRKPAEHLAQALAERGVAHTLSVTPGPHNQPWLREVGTLEMLLWHERRLAAKRG